MGDFVCMCACIYGCMDEIGDRISGYLCVRSHVVWEKKHTQYKNKFGKTIEEEEEERKEEEEQKRNKQTNKKNKTEKK